MKFLTYFQLGKLYFIFSVFTYSLCHRMFKSHVSINSNNMQLIILKMFVFMKDVQTLYIHLVFGISIEKFELLFQLYVLQYHYLLVR